MVRDAIKSGALKATEVPNERAGKDDVDKLLRLRRHDGEEFAIDRKGRDFLIWSSAPPIPLAEVRNEYFPHETRSSNLDIMRKLRGPNKSGRFGTHAWRLRFHTAMNLIDFIKGT